MSLIIIGASAVGRETYSYAQACGIKVKGYLDSREDILSGYKDYPPILGAPEEYLPCPDDFFVCAIGDPSCRKKYVDIISVKGGRFVSIVHPSALISDGAKIGVGCIVRPMAVIGNDAQIGSHVIVGTQSLVAHDCRIGDYVEISPGCHIAGWCIVADRVFMGVHAALIPHVSIGEDVFIAAGAVVTRSCSSGRLMGIPAKEK